MELNERNENLFYLLRKESMDKFKEDLIKLIINNSSKQEKYALIDKQKDILTKAYDDEIERLEEDRIRIAKYEKEIFDLRLPRM